MMNPFENPSTSAAVSSAKYKREEKMPSIHFSRIAYFLEEWMGALIFLGGSISVLILMVNSGETYRKQQAEYRASPQGKFELEGMPIGFSRTCISGVVYIANSSRNSLTLHLDANNKTVSCQW